MLSVNSRTCLRRELGMRWAGSCSIFMTRVIIAAIVMGLPELLQELNQLSFRPHNRPKSYWLFTSPRARVFSYIVWRYWLFFMQLFIKCFTNAIFQNQFFGRKPIFIQRNLGIWINKSYNITRAFLRHIHCREEALLG